MGHLMHRIFFLIIISFEAFSCSSLERGHHFRVSYLSESCMFRRQSLLSQIDQSSSHETPHTPQLISFLIYSAG